MVYLIALVALVFIAFVFLVLININAFIKAKSNGVDLSFVNIVFSRLRGLNPDVLVDSYIMLLRAGICLTYQRLETHALCGGDVFAVSEGAVSALKSNLDIDFDGLCKLDLAGRDVLGAVESYVHPIVINCPPKDNGLHKDGFIVAVPQDGIRLGIGVKVTVRSDLNKLVGGAGKATVAARVQEKILGAVGAASTHKEILNNPGIIVASLKSSENVLDGTYFSLVSVDVSEMHVLDNLKAHLDSVQSEADKKVAESRAEAKRVEAKARQQEMKAKLQEMQANVVSAKVCLPSAMRDGIGEGVIGSRKTPVKNVSQWRSQLL